MSYNLTAKWNLDITFFLVLSIELNVNVQIFYSDFLAFAFENDKQPRQV